MIRSELGVRATETGSVALVYYPDSDCYELQLTDLAGNLHAVPVAAFAAEDAFHNPQPYIDAALAASGARATLIDPWRESPRPSPAASAVASSPAGSDAARAATRGGR